MPSYLNRLVDTPTPQSEPLDPAQVENHAGGYVWQIGPLDQLRRWLVMGSEDGSHYQSERKLTVENVAALDAALALDPAGTLELVRAVSHDGRALRNDQAVFALAYAVAWGKRTGDRLTVDNALSLLPQVCRTATHLFQWVGFLDAWGKASGRSVRRALAAWYTGAHTAAQDIDAEPRTGGRAERLAYQLVKYRNREGWTHRDVLRIAHPARDPEIAGLLEWAAHPERFGVAHLPSGQPITVRMEQVAVGSTVATAPGGQAANLPAIIDGFLAAQASPTPARTAELVLRYRLPREALNPAHLTDRGVWEALLHVGMPLGALVRNLANMTRVGLIDGLSAATQTVVSRLSDPEAIRASRLHPMTLLVASRTYAQGHGERGRNAWTPAGQVVDALDEAFYLAFPNVQPTGIPHLLAVDVSGSMSSRAGGTPLTCREAAAAMALVIANVEPRWQIVGFSAPSGVTPSHQSQLGGKWGGGHPGLTPLDITPRMRLQDVCEAMRRVPMGGTDCALPMRSALDRGLDVGMFVVLTDSETWWGDMHPAEALRRYRRMRADAKLAIVAMTPTSFTIADPEDAGSMDFSGFDTAVPTLVADLAAGRL